MGSRGTVKTVKYQGSNDFAGGQGDLEIIQRYISVFVMFITLKIPVATMKKLVLILLNLSDTLLDVYYFTMQFIASLKYGINIKGLVSYK